MKTFPVKLRSVAALGAMFLLLTAAHSTTNEVGPPRMAVFSGTGTVWVTTSSLDVSGQALSTWRRVTKFRYLPGGTGSGTVTLGLHLVSGWGETGSALTDNVEWSDEWQLKEMDMIDNTGIAKKDTVAMMANGAVTGILVLGGE